MIGCVGRRHRTAALAATVVVLAVATLFAGPAAANATAAPADTTRLGGAAVARAAHAPEWATPGVTTPGVTAPGSVTPGLAAPGDLCSVPEWQADFHQCVDRLADVGRVRAQCLTPPTPSAPDSGLAGWFASRPTIDPQNGIAGFYSLYGQAGYSYTTYDVGCLPSVLHPDYKFENTIANGEFMIAAAIVGAANALRERAWNPHAMWGWADPLVEQATQAIYRRVFSVFGVITLAVVGLYLLWRSRQADMSGAMTTAGWALFVMVAVTALAAWPVRSANLADTALTTTLGVVHEAVGPQAKTPDPGRCVDPTRCTDRRAPATRAADTVTEAMLYRNWLRGALGSADSETAQKYGRALYDAKTLTWEEAQKIQENPATRNATYAQKNRQWLKVAEQIKAEDPEAYEYLRGTRGMERIGAGFIAILAAVFFALFDVTASILVLLGFLLFRWAVIAAPVLGTVGLLHPASAGIRRLANAVVAALFNIAIFGTGAAVYLFAVDLIMNTPTLPGWLQVVLVWLCGVVGWLLLRPYRRITQLGGKDSTAPFTSAGSWHRRFWRDIRWVRPVLPSDTAEPQPTTRPNNAVVRPEGRPEGRVDEAEPLVREPARPHGRRRPEYRWVEPERPDEPPRYAIYVPDSVKRGEPAPERVRAEAR